VPRLFCHYVSCSTTTTQFFKLSKKGQTWAAKANQEEKDLAENQEKDLSDTLAEDNEQGGDDTTLSRGD
jgi:hypothetical protein